MDAVFRLIGEFERELNLSWRLGCCEVPEARSIAYRCTDGSAGRSGCEEWVVMVQNIEEFRTEFEVGSLRESKQFEEREVYLLGSWASYGISIDITERAFVGIGEGAGIEIGAGDAGFAIRVANVIGALRTADIAASVGNVCEVDCVGYGVPVSG